VKRVLVTQRVVRDAARGERRDALDQAWPAFLAECELVPLVLPNHLHSAERLLSELDWDGLLLTGGNDLEQLGGDAPERDAVERLALERALAARRPVIGVCRGMQFLQQHCGVPLARVEGHAVGAQRIEVEGVPAELNSFHHFGTRESVPELAVFARAADGVVKAVRHSTHALLGLMWHPERMQPFRAADVRLFRALYSGASAAESARECAR
jgi:gamma-glutamyl-gamma-aminobutyrate hydrolase PuuD